MPKELEAEAMPGFLHFTSTSLTNLYQLLVGRLVVSFFPDLADWVRLAFWLNGIGPIGRIYADWIWLGSVEHGGTTYVWLWVCRLQSCEKKLGILKPVAMRLHRFQGLTWIEMISESRDGESLWLGTNPLHVNWNHVSICLYFSDHFFSSNLAKLLCACAWFTRQALAMRQDPRIGWCLCRLFWCHVDEKTGWGWRRCWRGLQRFEIWWLQRFHDCFCCITDATCTVKICGNAQTSNPCTQT